MTAQPPKQPPAERLLDAASELFTREGIRAVGVDRLLTESGVARASLYHAFGSKDRLIAAYIERQDTLDRAAWERAARGKDPASKILLLFDLARDGAVRRGFQGCLYLNASTEFPNRAHPVTEAVTEHRQWVRESLVNLLEQLGVTGSGETVDALQLIYDGAQAGSKISKSTEPFELAKKMTQQMLDDFRTEPAAPEKVVSTAAS